ncbi:ABC transporter ATP-binding protein [Thermodesulfobacteriota bacterium]
MNKPVIEVERLSKLYHLGALHNRTNSFREKVGSLFRNTNKPEQDETIWALKDITLKVNEGDILGVIGPNGAGKSTLLKILSRITKPTSGEVRINGRVGSLLEVGTGFHPELTGRENIFLNGAILGMRRAEIKRKFDEITSFAEVDKFLDTPVKRYSSGMYVRLAFAVAAHLQPEILLVDEVLAVGDAAFQKKCLNKMEGVAGEGRTILFVSHNIGAVASLCSKAILLNQGKFVKAGSTSDVINAYISEVQGSAKSVAAESHFSDNPDKFAQIRRIGISDPSGKPCLSHNILNPVHIDIDFDVKRSFHNLFVACTVKTSMNQIVFTTNEMDMKNFKGPHLTGVFPKKPGQYKATVILPNPLLHVGTYELTCALAAPDIGRVDFCDGMYFDIQDIGGSFATFPFKRNGLLALPLQWHVDFTPPV